MTKSRLILISICYLGLLNGCNGGGTPPPPPVATHFSLSGPATEPAGTAFSITVTALDASNRMVTTYSGMVQFSSSDPLAVTPGNSSMSNGTGTFSVTFKTTGMETITVSDTAAGISSGPSTINVTALPATHFSVMAPATASSGIVISITVNALDASNNLATGYSGTVHFSSTDVQAVLPVPPNTTLTNGTGSFSATLKTIANAATITATDAAMASITGSSNPINVVSNAATHLSVGSPGSATTRTSTNITVNALDAANNVSASYTGTVQVTSSDTKAVLPGKLPLANGTGNFSATFESTGPQTITATDIVTSSITGTSISIGVTAAAVLAVSSGAPPNGTIGLAYNPHTVRYCRVWAPFSSRLCLQWGTREAFGFTLTGAGGVPPYTWSWAPAANSSLPPSLVIANGDIISGTPSATGNYTVILTLNDSGIPPAPTTANYTIVINNPPPPVINATPAPSAGSINLPYSFTFTASSAAPPLTWRVSVGTPPAGLTLNPDGVLSGTPTATGTSPITLIAEDSLKQDSAPQDFTIQIFAHGFKATGSMATPHIAHTTTLLNTGKVLVAGGTDANGKPIATAELYDPTNGTFSTTGSMATARAHFAATLLPNGKVLITGGLDTNWNPLATAELYDPTNGTFSATTGNMQFVHASHTATLLNTGKVLVAGWGNATAELFDPSTGTFVATGSMMAARVSHTATLLKSGKVLVTGGIGGVMTVLAEAELYDPTTGSFSLTLGSLATARQWHTASLLADGRVLVTGGMLDNSGKATATAELFDPTTQLFTATSGSLTTPRGFQTATVLKDGTVLVTGGDAGSGPLATAEVYDPTTGTFSPTGSMGTTRESHTATLLNDGTVLVTGGTGSGAATAELYQ